MLYSWSYFPDLAVLPESHFEIPLIYTSVKPGPGVAGSSSRATAPARDRFLVLFVYVCTGDLRLTAMSKYILKF